LLAPEPELPVLGVLLELELELELGVLLELELELELGVLLELELEPALDDPVPDDPY